MNEPSEEQQIIIDHIKDGKNVVVNAVAGSGKSTTIISLSRQLPDKTIFQITYNSMLRHEMKEKIQHLALPNLTIHTFHSLAVKYYLESAHTDTEIRQIMFKNVLPRIPLPNIHILTIDEAQDMSLLYFQFIMKVVRDMGEPPQQIMILGDNKQTLYEFKGADSRFLTMAHRIWSKQPAFGKNPFEQCELRTSYRITHPMASFVNRAMLGEDRMVAARTGEPVNYIRNSRYNIEKTVLYHIQQLLRDGARPSDIFILAGSIKGINSHVRRLENILVENNIPCHLPILEQDRLDERVIGGKIVFSTFHTVKGRQRKHVFVVGFDQSYFQTMAFGLDSKKCPNTLYVGCTRATDGLYLLEFDNYSTDRPLDFLHMSHHDMNAVDFVKFKGMPQSIFGLPSSEKNEGTKQEKRYLTPTKLIKFIPDSVMNTIAPLISKIFECTLPKENERFLDIPSIIKTADGYEDVSDLNGIAIPAMYYDEIQKKWNGGHDTSSIKNVLYTMIEEALSEMRENDHLYLKTMVKSLPKTCETIDEYLFLANVYVSIQERLYFKLKQIQPTEYGWLSPEMIQECRNRLEETIGKELENLLPNESVHIFTEETILHSSDDEKHHPLDTCLSPHFFNTVFENNKFRFTAIVDLITPVTVWEIKCTSKITIDHQLQLIIYAWLWMTMNREPKQFKIFNIKTGEIWTLHATSEELTFIMVKILQGKFLKQPKKTDTEFLEDTQRTDHWDFFCG